MDPFQIMNARNQTIEEILRVNTGREEQREIVHQAILDSSHNVYIYGTRGSGKTFFQKTQAHYFNLLDDNVLSLYVPISLEFLGRGRDFDAEIFAFHILNIIVLELWNKLYNRPKSDLIRITALDEHSVLDDLNSSQKHFVKLYKILHTNEFNAMRRKALSYGASAVAKAESKQEESQTYSRNGLIPSETLVILDEVAELISKSDINRIIVHLDEIEFLDSNVRERLLSLCLWMFNPIGVQFVATGVPTDIGDGDNFLSSVETVIEIEGLSTHSDLGLMITKYANGSIYSFEKEAIAVLYEFFKGHPRISLMCCSNATKYEGTSGKPIAPYTMTKACLEVQKRFAVRESTKG